jgi:2-dehydropantoate 2-reductase
VIAVLGAGAVGGLVAGLLARAGEDVVVVSRRPVDRLVIESAAFGDVDVRVDGREALDDVADVLLVAPKASALSDALVEVRTEPRLVVPLLNGVEHMATLRERFGRVGAGAIRVQAERVGPGAIRHTSAFARVDLADEAVEAAPPLERAGLEVRAGGVEADVLWAKLARLAPLALATTAWDADLGPVRSTPELRDLLRGAVRETAAVARAEGADVDARTVQREIDGLPDTASSSLRRDVATGVEGELDAIAGAVVRAGERHGLACTSVDTLAGLVRRRLERQGQARGGSMSA